jgi:hypothetical protein
MTLHLPIGVSDFRELIEYTDPKKEGYLYIDKTTFIKEIIYDLTKVIVLTRPRRFGKTLNLSMLQYFFASEVKGKSTKKLFNNLAIAKELECMEHQGQYPVIFISFKDIKELTFASTINGLLDLVKDLYTEWSNILLTSDKINKADQCLIEDTLQQNLSEDKLKRALKNLVNMVATATGQQVYILIDEYDTPIQEAYIRGYYDQLIVFMRGFLSGPLKDNTSVKQSILTGILRVSKESLFSGLSNLEIYSILDQKYCNYFGFTENEVNDLLIKVGLPTTTNQTKEWYNGYNFGNTTIYNPWSIIKFIKGNGDLKSYWVNTSGNELVKDLIINSSYNIQEDIAGLIAGKTIQKNIDEHIVFNDLKNNPESIWSLLLMSGYLKYLSYERKGRRYVCKLKLPNNEVEDFYTSVVEDWLIGDRGSNWYKEFIDSLANGKVAEFEEMLQRFVEETLSFHDVTKKQQEYVYHSLLLGFTAGLKGTHFITSNRESGEGRYDVLIVPKDINRLGIIMEFKAVKNKKQLGSAAKEALNQIKKLKYSTELQARGISHMCHMGISFSGKSLKIISDSPKTYL